VEERGGEAGEEGGEEVNLKNPLLKAFSDLVRRLGTSERRIEVLENAVKRANALNRELERRTRPCTCGPIRRQQGLTCSSVNCVSHEMEWRKTNYRERHLRINGRIVGKLARAPRQRKWTAIVYQGDTRQKRVVIGSHADEGAAKALVMEAARGGREVGLKR
jgi:hypothetical protein